MRLWLLLVLCLSAIGSYAVASDIQAIRFGKQGDGTRIVIDMTSKATPSIFLLGNPSRVVVDIAGGEWKASSAVRSLGVVEGYRHGHFSRDTYRLVFDLEGPAIVRRSFALAPSSRYGHRYVIDLAPTNKANFASAVEKTKERRAKPKAVEPEIAMPKRKIGQKPLVVIDAGHGGPDPGTLGVLGVNEKIVTLGVANRLKRELEKTGKFRVRLTRDKDFFIKVRERFKIARRWGADLFISIHADAIANPKVRGGTVYTLSESASDKEAARLANRENKSDLIAGVDLDETADDVSTILIDLAQRETMNVSAQFAEILLFEMRKDMRMHKRGHRFANLGVLKAPDVPSVLIETGYLSNREDAKFLASSAGQQKIAHSIRRGVEKYFERSVEISR